MPRMCQRLPADADRPAVVIGEAHRKEVQGRRIEGHVRCDAQAGEFLCELADALAERLNDVDDVAVLNRVIEQHAGAAAFAGLHVVDVGLDRGAARHLSDGDCRVAALDRRNLRGRQRRARQDRGTARIAGRIAGAHPLHDR